MTAKEILKQYFGDYHDTAYDKALSELRELVMGQKKELDTALDDMEFDDTYTYNQAVETIADLFGSKGEDTFPTCSKECEIVKELGVGECESVCPKKFPKIGGSNNATGEL